MSLHAYCVACGRCSQPSAVVADHARTKMHCCGCGTVLETLFFLVRGDRRYQWCAGGGKWRCRGRDLAELLGVKVRRRRASS